MIEYLRFFRIKSSKKKKELIYSIIQQFNWNSIISNNENKIFNNDIDFGVAK